MVSKILCDPRFKTLYRVYFSINKEKLNILTLKSWSSGFQDFVRS